MTKQTEDLYHGLRETANRLEEYNQWRRGEGKFRGFPHSSDERMPDVKQLGQDIDTAVRFLRVYIKENE